MILKLKFVMIMGEVDLFESKKLSFLGEIGFRGAPDSAVCADCVREEAKSEVA